MNFVWYNCCNNEPRKYIKFDKIYWLLEDIKKIDYRLMCGG